MVPLAGRWRSRLVAWQAHAASENVAERQAMESVGFEVSTHHTGYGHLVRSTLGDPLDRMNWRTNEALDYVSVLQLAYNTGARSVCRASLVWHDDRAS